MDANRLAFASCLLFFSFVMGPAVANAPARAQESAPGQGSEAPRQAADAVTQGATQNNPAEQPAIQVENWSQPQPGWLSVLDPKAWRCGGTHLAGRSSEWQGDGQHSHQREFGLRAFA